MYGNMDQKEYDRFFTVAMKLFTLPYPGAQAVIIKVEPLYNEHLSAVNTSL